VKTKKGNPQKKLINKRESSSGTFREEIHPVAFQESKKAYKYRRVKEIDRG